MTASSDITNRSLTLMFSSSFRVVNIFTATSILRSSVKTVRIVQLSPNCRSRQVITFVKDISSVTNLEDNSRRLTNGFIALTRREPRLKGLRVLLSDVRSASCLLILKPWAWTERARRLRLSSRRSSDLRFRAFSIRCILVRLTGLA